jgi:polysaccharide export outer membrane protein
MRSDPKMAEQKTRKMRAVAHSRVERAWRVLVLGASILCVACAETLPFTWVQEMPPPPAAAPAEPIHPGDTLTIFVREQETLSGDFKVREDGTYPQPIVGAMHVAGRTPDQVTSLLKQRLQGVLAAPEVAVSIAERRPIRIGVVGEVNSPGLFEVAADDGVLGLLSRAGGLNDFADEDEIYVVRRQPELRRVRISYRDLMLPDNAASRFRLLDGDTIVVE